MTATSSHDHDKLVEMTASRMVNQGFTRVRSCHGDRYMACDQIGDYIPDTTALSGIAPVIAEAESREGLTEAHTEAQWKTFHSHANRVGGWFVAVVNKSDEAAAKVLLNRVCGIATNVQLWTF